MSKVRSITPLPPADFTPELGNYKTLQPFRYWCQKVLPLVYDDSLSYYELLCKVVDYLNKTMEDVETLHGDVTNLHTAYGQLQNYVNTYFSSLDVQQEINNKLNKMVLDGTLSELIMPIITNYSTPVFVSSTAEMVDPKNIYILLSNGHIYYYENGFKDSGISYGSSSTFSGYYSGNPIIYPTSWIDSTFDVGHYLLKNGTLAASSAGLTTPFIPAPIKGTINYNARNTLYVCFYNSDFSFIRSESPANNISIPENCVYFRCSFFINDNDNKLIINDATREYLNVGQPKLYNNLLNVNLLYDNQYTLKGKAFNPNSGAIVNGASYQHITPYIDITDVNKELLYTGGNISYTCTLVQYDQNCEIIKFNNYITDEITLDENCKYIRADYISSNNEQYISFGSPTTTTYLDILFGKNNIPLTAGNHLSLNSKMSIPYTSDFRLTSNMGGTKILEKNGNTLSLSYNNEVLATCTLTTNSGVAILNQYDYKTVLIAVESNGNVITSTYNSNVSINFTGDYNFSCSGVYHDCWIIGDSYWGLSEDRVGGALINMGIDFKMLCNYPGASSTPMLSAVRTLLKAYTPKRIIWGLGMNGADDININDLNSLKTICDKSNINLIPIVVPSVPSIDHSNFANWVKNNFDDYIDIKNAVEVSNSVWKSGLLSSDGVHPTQAGANVIASIYSSYIF